MKAPLKDFIYKKRPVTSKQIARVLGIHNTRLSQLCSRYAQPTPQELEKLTKFFGKSEAELFGHIDL